jgi:Ase1/PRC1/MAP65 family protein
MSSVGVGSPRHSLSHPKSAFTPVNRSHCSTMVSSPPLANLSTQAPSAQKSLKKTPRSHLSYSLMLTPSRTVTESFTAMVSSTAQKLEDIWDEVGYSPEDRTSELSDLLAKFRDLCEAKLAEERSVAESFRQTIDETKAEIASTSKALKINAVDNLLGADHHERGTLTDELAILEATLDGLREIAASAKLDLEKCRDYLLHAYRMLGLTLEETWLDVDSDLTLERRERFHLKVEEMKEEIATRSSAIIQLLRDCQHLLKEMQIDEEVTGSALDHQIARSLNRLEGGSFVMSDDFRTDTCTGISASALEDLTERVAALNAEKRKRTSKLEEMGVQIMTLWEKLRISEQEQQAFTVSIQGLGLDTIAKGEAELERLHALKSQMLGNLILEARQTIIGLWDEMNATETFKKAFLPFGNTKDKEFTESALEEHENYIDYLKGQLEEMRPILRIIERRDAILRERKEYQELQQDSDRLKQRGAALTKQLMEEEKMARRIKRELPKLTSMLEEKLMEWEHQHHEKFQLRGENYIDVMERQENEWTEYKSALLLKKKKLVDNRGSASSSRLFADATSRENRSTSRLRGRDDGPRKPRPEAQRTRSTSRTRVL